MRTHCKRGHRYDEANTYINPKGRRSCRACGRKSRKAWAARNPVIRTEKDLEREREYREKNREAIRARKRKSEGNAHKHHLEERTAIVAYLRKFQLMQPADAIEAGEHLK